jgi:hypothetical protein
VPPFPASLSYLWSIFLRISNRRGQPGPLLWSEIDAFLRVSKVRLAPWEIEVIEELDRLYVNAGKAPD